MKGKELSIAHVFATFLPVSSGGVEHHILSVSKHVHRLGYHSLLVTPRYRFHARSLPKTDDIGYLRILRVGLVDPPYVKTRFIEPLLNSTLNRLNSKLGAWIRKRYIGADLLHIHSGYFSLELGFELGKWISRPFIVTMHERISDISEKYYRILKAAKKIVVHREFNQTTLEKWGLGYKTVHVPMFIDVGQYRKPSDYESLKSDTVRILFIGRLENRRDPLSLIRAFSNVYRNHPNVELQIIGNGSLREGVETLVRRHGLERHVTLEGEQPDVRRYLWSSNIYVSTNTVDDYPSLALREAMSAGLAVIDTDVGEIRKLICNGRNGLLIPASDPVALTKAIRTLIEDVRLRKRIITEAQLSAKDFDIARGIKPLLRIYREVSG